MSFNNRGSNLPGIAAGTDLTNAQHRFITIDSTGRAVLSGAGGRISAVIENDPNVGQAASLMGPGSVSKVASGAAIALGDLVASDAAGRAVTAISGDYVVGVCVDAAAAVDELCSVWMLNEGGGAAGPAANFTNAGRPDPTTVPVGFPVYNTTSSRPNYSDGTVWRTGDGTAT